MTFAQFLLALQGPLINVAVGVVLSFLVEYWPAYVALLPKYKRLVMAGLCLLIPIAAASLAVLLHYQPGSIDATWWPAAVAGAAAFGVSTGAHTRLLSNA